MKSVATLREVDHDQRLAGLRKKLEQIQTVRKSRSARVTQRGEKLEELAARAEELTQESHTLGRTKVVDQLWEGEEFDRLHIFESFEPAPTSVSGCVRT